MVFFKNHKKSEKNTINEDDNSIFKKKKNIFNTKSIVIYIFLIATAVLICVISEMGRQIVAGCSDKDKINYTQMRFLDFGIGFGIGMLLYAFGKLFFEPFLLVLFSITWIVISSIYINSFKGINKAYKYNIDNIYRLTYGILGCSVGLLIFAGLLLYLQKYSHLKIILTIWIIANIFSLIFSSVCISIYNKCVKNSAEKQKNVCVVLLSINCIMIAIGMSLIYYKKNK